MGEFEMKKRKLQKGGNYYLNKYPGIMLLKTFLEIIKYEAARIAAVVHFAEVSRG